MTLIHKMMVNFGRTAKHFLKKNDVLKYSGFKYAGNLTSSEINLLLPDPKEDYKAELKPKNTEVVVQDQVVHPNYSLIAEVNASIAAYDLVKDRCDLKYTLIAKVDAAIAEYNLVKDRCDLKLQEAKAKYSFLNQSIAKPQTFSSLSPLSNEYLQKISSIPNDEWNPIKWDEDQWNSILLSGNCEEQCIINS